MAYGIGGTLITFEDGSTFHGIYTKFSPEPLDNHSPDVYIPLR